MQENFSAAGAPTWTPEGSLQHYSIPHSWWGGSWLPLDPQEPQHPALGPSSLASPAPAL